MPRLSPRTLLWTGLAFLALGVLWSTLLNAVTLRGVFSYSYTWYSLIGAFGPAFVTFGSALVAGALVLAAVTGRERTPEAGPRTPHADAHAAPDPTPYGPR